MNVYKVVYEYTCYEDDGGIGVAYVLENSFLGVEKKVIKKFEEKYKKVYVKEMKLLDADIIK